MKEIQTVILAGGRGERMGIATENAQKCMLEFEEKPVLEHILDNLSKAFGSAEVIIATGYKGNTVSDYFGKSYRGLTLNYVHDERPLETKKRMLLAKDLVVSPFLFLAGDIISPSDLMVQVMERLEKEKGRIGVLAGATDHSPAPTHALLTILEGNLISIEHPPNNNDQNGKYREMHVTAYDLSFIELAEQSNQHLLSRVVSEIVNSSDDSLFGGQPFEGEWVHIAEPEDLLTQRLS